MKQEYAKDFDLSGTDCDGCPLLMEEVMRIPREMMVPMFRCRISWDSIFSWHPKSWLPKIGKCNLKKEK